MNRDSKYLKANEKIHLVIYYESEQRYKQYNSCHIQKFLATKQASRNVKDLVNLKYN